MTDTQIKSAAITKLQAAGVEVSNPITLTALAHLIGRHTGVKLRYGNNAGDFVHAYVCPPRAAPKQATFRPLVAAPHPRAADIDAAQPPVMTPCMVGNGPENSKVWRR